MAADADPSSDEDDMVLCRDDEFWAVVSECATGDANVQNTRAACPLRLIDDKIPDHVLFDHSLRNQSPFVLAKQLTQWPGVEACKSLRGLGSLPVKGATTVLFAHDNTNFLKNELTSAADLGWGDAITTVLNQPTGRRGYLRTTLAAVDGLLQEQVPVSRIGKMVTGELSGIAPFKPANCGLWISSPGCVTPLHYDLCHGFLCQIRGTKRVRMFAPTDLRSLYPNPPNAANPNTSQIDLSKWLDGDEQQRIQFPKVENADLFETVLEPGQCLYIPPFWWHHVETLDQPSCSVLLPFDPDYDRGEGIHPCIEQD